MAGYNEILVGRYNRALQKILSMKGAASMNELASILQPSVSFFYRAEFRYLEDWDRRGAIFDVPAQGAGAASAARIRNPLTSGQIAVIEKILISNNSAVADRYVLESSGQPNAAANTDLGTVAAGPGRFDSRFGPLSASSAITTTLGTSLGLSSFY